MEYALQNRWKIEGNHLYYYGLRNKENLLKNKRKLSSKQLKVIRQLPKSLSPDEMSLLGPLLGTEVVLTNELRETPKSLEEAQFCTRCAANTYMIPGLEFNEEGECPICQTKELTRQLRSVVPLVEEIPHAKNSRFDVALFYTGGKDSTYLLYYLAKVKRLRVLALTWEIPYLSANAQESIQNAKRHFSTVEFINRYVSNADMQAIYKKLYELSGNTCACPSLAYILFYPTLVEERVPYFIAGNEPAQLIGLYYNGLAPKMAYTFSNSKISHFIINIGRILTLHPPLKRGQLHTLMTMRQLVYGDSLLKRWAGYKNDLISNVVEAIHQVPGIIQPLKRSLRKSSWRGHIPAFVQIDLDKISGGTYDWKSVKELIEKECGWVSLPDNTKGLHTSCKIEKCKEYSQFIRFYQCKSKLIPFSALEMALASGTKSLSKEESIQEIRTHLGFSLEEVPECKIMTQFIDKKW